MCVPEVCSHEIVCVKDVMLTSTVQHDRIDTYSFCHIVDEMHLILHSAFNIITWVARWFSWRVPDFRLRWHEFDFRPRGFSVKALDDSSPCLGPRSTSSCGEGAGLANGYKQADKHVFAEVFKNCYYRQDAEFAGNITHGCY